MVLLSILGHPLLIWGFGGNYPIFKIENVGYDEVLNELSTNDINILAASPTTEEIEVIHSKLYDALPSGMIYGYSYKPGIGLFSQIDPNKQETFYDYNDFGRLKLIKDNDGNIVKVIAITINWNKGLNVILK